MQRVTKGPNGRGWIIAFDGISGVGKSDFALLAVSVITSLAHARVALFHENSLDPVRESIGMVNRKFQQWGLPPDQVNGALFAVGRSLIMPTLQQLAERNDLVVCDRSLWSNVCYQSDSGDRSLTMKQLYELNAMLGVIVPDVGFVVDGEVKNCLIRRAYREKRAVGTAGQMGGDVEKQKRIRERFLQLPALFDNYANLEVVSNPGDPIEADDGGRWAAAQDNFRKGVIPVLVHYGILK